VLTLTQESGFDFLSAEYGRLFEEAGATAFQHPIWLDRLYRTLAPGLEAEPVIVTAREGGPQGRLRMVMPLVRRRHKGLRLIEFADLQVSDYACPVGDEAAFRVLAGDPRVRARIRDLLRPYDVVRIKKVPEGAPPLEQMLPAARRKGMAVGAHATSLKESFSDWQAEAMSASYVKELARKRRRLARRGAATFELAQEPALVEAAFRQMRAWRAKRFPGDLLQQDLYYGFYADIARSGAESGLSRTLRLALDGQTIGVVWVVCFRGTCVMLMGGFDFEAYKGCSIGALAFEDLARDCIARKDQVLDFSIGDEAYKALFGCRPAPLWMIAASGTPLGLIANSVAPSLAKLPGKGERRGVEEPAAAAGSA
jgi:CelD/BcsL family acetyltransferase involved in cellulose biosynthesis